MFRAGQIYKTIVTIVFAISAGLTSTCNADGVQWETDIESALTSANQNNQLVLMKFTADWCGYCKKMERTTFTAPEVVNVVEQNFVPVLVDADKHKDLVSKLRVKGLPALLIVSPEMMIVERITGYQTAPKLLPKLNTIVAASSPRPTVPVQTASIPQPDSASAIPQFTPASQENPFAGLGVQQQPVPQTPARPVTLTKESPIAFQKLCLTSVVEQRKLVQGQPKVELVWKGKRLLFASELQRQQFQKNPEKYWPMLDGACAMTLLKEQRVAEGQLQHAAVFRNQIWLFQSQDLMKEFIASPAAYADELKTLTATIH